MKINNNMAALSVLNELNRNSNKLGCMAEKAASGVCINFAGDDASGYSISEKMRVQLRSLAQDVENVQTGRNMVAVAEGGIQEIIENLRYIKEKAINAANDHNTDADRAFIQKEVDARLEEINDIASSTTYNGRILLNGDYGEGKVLGVSVKPGYSMAANTLNNLTSAFSIVGGDGQETSDPAYQVMKFNNIVGNKAYQDTVGYDDTVLKVDFSGAGAPSGSLSYPASFDRQGFCMGCWACKAYINIVFDASMRPSESVVVLDDTGETAAGEHSANQVNWSYSYVIGIKGATDEKSLSKAFYDGVIAANDKENSCPEGWDVTVNKDGEGYFGYPWDWTHNTRIAYEDGQVLLKRETTFPWVFYDAGAFGVDIQRDANQPTLNIHTGVKASQNIALTINDMHTRALGIEGLSLRSRGKAEAALSTIDSAIEYALDENTRMGAYQARLKQTEANLVTSNENTTAAESVIRDADMARTMMEYAKYNVLQQASQSMLAQANSLPDGVLGLLQ